MPDTYISESNSIISAFLYPSEAMIIHTMTVAMMYIAANDEVHVVYDHPHPEKAPAGCAVSRYDILRMHRIAKIPIFFRYNDKKDYICFIECRRTADGKMDNMCAYRN